MPLTDTTVSPREFAAATQTPYTTVIDRIKAGTIPAAKDAAGAWRIARGEMERIIAERDRHARDAALNRRAVALLMGRYREEANAAELARVNARRAVQTFLDEHPELVGPDGEINLNQHPDGRFLEGEEFTARLALIDQYGALVKAEADSHTKIRQLFEMWETMKPWIEDLSRIEAAAEKQVIAARNVPRNN